MPNDDFAGPQDPVAQTLLPSPEEVSVAVEEASQNAAPIGRWLIPLAVPPAIGLALIVIATFSWGSSTLDKSAGEASTALVVGALLILGSAALYIVSPVRYDHFFTDLRLRLGGES